MCVGGGGDDRDLSRMRGRGPGGELSKKILSVGNSQTIPAGTVQSIF